jgi:two-component system phosphate regulon sensor histidine kinase PhoR
MSLIFGGDRVPDAIKALEEELAGGPTAELPPPLDMFARLAGERVARSLASHLEAPEQELLAALPDAAAIVGKNGKVRLANPLFDALSPSGGAVGMTALEVTRNVDLAEAVKRALEGSARQLELLLQRRTYLAQISPLLRGEVLALLRDQTELKRAELARRDFVASASHELRTPIAAIAGAAETLLAGAMGDPSQARTFIDVVARHADRLARLTRDLLDLSRIESGQWALELGPVEVAPTARTVIDLLSDAAREKKMSLRLDVAPDIRVTADARALEQVLVNLLDNAVKYTPGRGAATIGAQAEDGWVTISVTDSGMGIERHHLTRLFERFYRVDPGRSRDAGGTGLGLAIVKHLVQAQGGEVGVESGAEGSRFWVRLPRPG